ncbi:MAG: HlyC/CorC family transporter [Chloroflexi bacterium]|nr:HlyC/CorC family transporter [Chloroflexota bacterium]
MSSLDVAYLVLMFFCVLFSAFFSSSESAMISLQKIRLEHMLSTGVKGATLLARLTEQPQRLISVILIGNNLVNTALAALATALALKYWPEQGVLIATVAVTVTLIIFGEAAPKTAGIQHAERLALAYARPIQLLSLVFSPFVAMLSWMASGLTRLVGGTPIPRSLVSEEEIRTMISVAYRDGAVEPEAAEMLHAVFEFGDRPAREVMVPRTEVVFVEKGTSFADFLALYGEQPFSRYPVYEEKRDNVIGILSVKDLMMAEAKGTITRDSAIDGFIRPTCFAPEAKPIQDLFVEMRDRRCAMSVVVDEFGGTSGIVSISRIVEEIVGPVASELAVVEKDYDVIDEHTFQVDGGMRVEDANEEMELGLPEGDYETVAGFILHLLKRIPSQGEHIRYKGLRLVITKMKGAKIEEILVTKEHMAKEEEGTHAAPQG